MTAPCVRDLCGTRIAIMYIRNQDLERIRRKGDDGNEPHDPSHDVVQAEHAQSLPEKGVADER